VLVFNVRDRGSSGGRGDTTLRLRTDDRATSSSAPLDEIVAVIDDQAITRFDVQQRVRARIQRNEVPEPTTEAAGRTLEQEALNGLIDEERLLQRAKELGIGVPDSDVASMVEAQIRETRSAFGTESEYENALAAGRLGTPDEYRQFLFDQYRVRLTLEKTRSTLKRGEDDLSGHTGGAANLAAGQNWIAHYHFEYRGDKRSGHSDRWYDEGGNPPSESSRGGTLRSSPLSWVTFRQIVIVPHPGAAATESARVEAESLLAEARMGADFKALAGRGSMDARAKGTGGDLSWIGRNVSMAEWDRWFFGKPLDPPLSPGQVIFKPVIETPFGFAVLRAEGAGSGRIGLKAILRTPKIDDSDVEQAKALAETVADALKGGAAWDTLANRYHDFTDGEPTGVFAPVRVDSLPVAYRTALESHAPNDIVVFYDTGSLRRPNLPRYVVAQLLAVEDRH
jgi:SurA-like N-terminal domain/PPIC-type PPIASE domain